MALTSCTCSPAKRRAATPRLHSGKTPFGRESAGIDAAILDRFADRCVRIPMREGLRSLNLSNAVAIAAYEALRQQGFQGLV